MESKQVTGRKEPSAEAPSESRGCDTAEGFQEWGADWDAWLAEKAARREQWLQEGPGHGSALGGGGLWPQRLSAQNKDIQDRHKGCADNEGCNPPPTIGKRHGTHHAMDHQDDVEDIPTAAVSLGRGHPGVEAWRRCVVVALVTVVSHGWPRRRCVASRSPCADRDCLRLGGVALRQPGVGVPVQGRRHGSGRPEESGALKSCGLSFGGLSGGGASECGLVGNECASSRQLDLVLPAFGDGPLATPLCDSGLGTAESFCCSSLGAEVSEKFLRAHAPDYQSSDLYVNRNSD